MRRDFETKWIYFERTDKPSKDAKTETYNVRSKDGDFLIGVVKWYTAWRKYCFFPANDCVFETDCLTDITFFVRMANEVHKMTRDMEKTAKTVARFHELFPNAGDKVATGSSARRPITDPD